MQRILVALDASPRADLVFAAALRLAELGNASLVVFRAVGVPPDMPSEILDLTDQRLEDILIRNARADLERRTRDVAPGRIERLVTELATPWDGICRAAREAKADMIVIGSHGYGGLDRVLGTTAAKVVNHSERNVLVVRTPL